MWWKGGGSALLDQVEQYLTGRDHSRRGFGGLYFCRRTLSLRRLRPRPDVGAKSAEPANAR